MFNLSLLALVPQLMGISQKVFRIVQGKGAPGEIREVITELRALLEQVPQLKGLLLLMDPILRIVDKVGAEIFDKPDMLEKMGITEEEVIAGKAIVEILGPMLGELEGELADAAAAVTVDDVDRLT